MHKLKETTETISWDRYSLYVVETLKDLIGRVDTQAKDLTDLQKSVLNDLIKIREEFRVEINKTETETNKLLSRSLEKIDLLIQKLSGKISIIENSHPEFALQEKIVELKENVLTPMRLKLAVISSFMGMLGGALFLIIVNMIQDLIKVGS